MAAFEQLDLGDEHNLDGVLQDPRGFMYVQYHTTDNVVQPIVSIQVTSAHLEKWPTSPSHLT